jgi:hypothetical protein
MDEKTFQRNYNLRWEKLKTKTERYHDSWRNYSINTLINLAKNRLEEVVDVFKDTGTIDLDNLVDSMNFLDFVIIKILDHYTDNSK